MRRYLSERDELIAAAAPGTSSARRLARLTDEMLRALADEAAPSLPRRTRWSLIALGGYGSGSLLPASDLDLLVVSNGTATALKPFVEAILYPLWDAGLAVGHQVRSKREQLAAVRADLATLTATLTGRVLAGDDRLGLEVLQACAKDAAKRPGEVLAAMNARPRPGSPYLLEPDLKDGAGGRRDFDELTWTAALLTGSPQSDPGALVTLGLLSPGDLDRLTHAADTIAAARWELQREGNGSFMSEEAAAALRTDPAAVQRAIADTHHLLLRIRRRASERGVAEDGPLSPQEFFELAGAGPASLDALEDAVWAGRLEHLVPGMRELMCLRRPGIAHTRTVGAHSLACATHAGRLLGESKHRRVVDRDALLVAALVHDIGKVEPGPGHAEAGAAPARAVAERFGLSASAADQVAALVRHHLFLAATATGIDLDDPAAIADAATRLGDRELLAPLHVLTIADSIATGPGAWSEWHAVLTRTLVRALERELVLTAALPPVASAPDPRIAMLAERVAADPAPAAHALDVSPGPIDGSFRVTVAAPDRPGLLATLAGVFGLAGFDILSATSSAEHPRVAVDTFVVASATLAPVSAESWTRLERLLAAALSDRLAINVRLTERRRHYAPRRTGALKTRIDEDASGATLHVRVPDRVGLLHDLARAIAESGLDVRSLTATSRAGFAEDTFRLTLAPGTGAGALGQLAMRLREL